MQGVDGSTGESGGADGVLIAGLFSSRACFAAEQELKEGEAGFATRTLSTSGKGSRMDGGAGESFTFWAEERLVWLVLYLSTVSLVLSLSTGLQGELSGGLASEILGTVAASKVSAICESFWVKSVGISE